MSPWHTALLLLLSLWRGPRAVVGLCDCSITFDDDGPRVAMLTPYDGMAVETDFDYPANANKHQVMLTEYFNKNDVCRWRVDAGLKQTNEGETYIDYVNVYFGVHSTSPKKYHRLLKIKAGEKVFVIGEGINPGGQGGEEVEAPWEFQNDDLTVSASELANVMTWIYSPECKFLVIYAAGTLDKLDRALLISSSTYDFTGLCGPCDEP